LKLKSLHLKNIASHKDTFYEFTKEDVYLLLGRNGCLSGDTVININRASLGTKRTIKHMYEVYRGLNKYVRHLFNKDIPTYVRSYKEDEGFIQLHEAIDFIYSGKKEVYELELENNLKIKATPEHKILTKRGFIPLINLVASDEVMCDTLKSNKVKNKYKKIGDRIKSCLIYHPYANNKIKKIELHRAIYEASINNLPLDDYLYIVKKDKQKAATLTYLDTTKYCLHHKDGNHFNNDINNLEKLSIEEHSKYHSLKNRYNFNQGVPTYSKVKKITKIGIEDTYDIQCKAPYHNFVANGMVVHNSGKSSFIGSMSLALFGEDPYYGNLYSCVRIGSEEEGSEIDLVFISGEDEYQIIRKIKINKSSKSTDSFLYKNGELIAGPKIKEFDNAIENILSNKKVFLSSVFTSQNIAEDITEMPVSERTELLNNLWDLEFLQKISDIAKDKVKQYTITYDTKNSQIESILATIEQEHKYIDMLKSVKESLQSLSEKKYRKEQEKNILEDKINQTKDLEEKKKEYNLLLSDFNRVKSRIDTLLKENEEKKVKINNEDALNSEFNFISDTQEDIVKLENDKNILQELINTKKEIESKLDNKNYLLQSVLKDIVDVPCSQQSCPYFTQMEERKLKKQELEKEISILKNEEKDLNNKISAINYNTTSIQSLIFEVQKRINRKNEIFSELKSISFIKESIDKNNIQLKEYYANKESLEVKLVKLDLVIKELIENTDVSIQDSLNILIKEIDIIKVEYDNALRLEGRYQLELDNILEKKKEVSAIQEEIALLKKDIYYYNSIKDDFNKKGIQSMVINSLKNELEKVIKDLLSNLNNNKFSINLSTKKELASGEEKESLEILVGDEQGIRDISQFSGGEKKLLKLIIRLALGIYQAMKNKVKYDFFVLDEATDALDQERRLGFIDIINSLRKYFKQILIISHSEELMGYFPNRIEFIKDSYTKII
jgi:DNA repair exonuclease SbcCD ATPase subunit